MQKFKIIKTKLNSWHPKYMQNFKTKLEVKISILLHGMKRANLKTISFILRRHSSCKSKEEELPWFFQIVIFFSNYLKTEKIWIDSLLPSSSLLILERARLL